MSHPAGFRLGWLLLLSLPRHLFAADAASSVLVQNAGSALRVTDFYRGETTWDSAFARAMAKASAQKSTIIRGKAFQVASAVFVPPGDYPFARTILVRDGIRLRGASEGATVLRYLGGAGVAVRLGGASISEAGPSMPQAEYSHVSVEDLSLRGSGDSTSIGIEFEGCNRGSWIRNCQVFGFGTNVRGIGSYGFSVQGNFIHDARGINLHWSSPTASTIRGNRIDDAGAEGILIDDGDRTEVIGLSISENIVQSSHREGVRIQDATQVSLSNNFFEANCLDGAVCSHILVHSSATGKPRKPVSLEFSGNFLTPGPPSKAFPAKPSPARSKSAGRKP